jgi:hypothetical protein
MIHIVNAENRKGYGRALRQMYRDRKMVFIERLGWNVAATGEFERHRRARLREAVIDHAPASNVRSVSAPLSSWPASGTRDMGGVSFLRLSYSYEPSASTASIVGDPMRDHGGVAAFRHRARRPDC